ncbi:MAG: thioredoxin family protein [Paracoccaceae bacterium]
MTRPLRLLTAILATALWAALAQAALAASSERYASDLLSARFITAEQGVAPDSTALSAALEIELSEGWKTYWKSPGEVGYPPGIDWSGAQNVAGVEMLWPAPTRFEAFGIENYGYAERVTFPLRFTLTDPGQPARLAGTVSLLVCKDVCVPETFDLALALDMGTGIDPAEAAIISQAAARVPGSGRAAGLTLDAVHLDDAALTLSARSETPFEAPALFPDLGADAAFGAPDIRLSDAGHRAWIRLDLLNAADTPPPLEVTLVDGARAALFRPALAPEAPTAPAGSGTPSSGASLLWIIALALLGGLILNVMPCVLPVLAIKLTSALKAHDQSPARIRGGFVMSALGVVSFMWALALILIALRAAGLQIGWGIQFQNPVFLALMSALIALFAANMAGLFEITLPQRWNTRLAGADGQPGLLGDFATGALAAILATPCSAPFLGTAVTFALAGSAPQTLAIFTALGLGLALPYLLVAARPALVQALPRPGRWMVVVKWVMGALLALTALWLLSVLLRVSGPLGAGLSAALIVLAILALSQSFRARGVVIAGLLAAATLGPALVEPPARAPAPVPDAAWQLFERDRIAAHIRENRVVFVDVTADWCLTCKANKSLVLDADPVRGALTAEGVVAMQADWTRPDPAILSYLQDNGRFGIPFNAVYGPAAPEGIKLPEILTRDAVMQALKDARG